MFDTFNEWLDNHFKNNAGTYGNITVVLLMGTVLIPFLGYFTLVFQAAYLAVRWIKF